MSISFSESETRQNLMRAFAGESQARSRYTIAAELCRQQQLYALEAVFTFTAGQEHAHGALFWKQLQPSSGTQVPLQADYPVDVTNDVSQLLRQAQQHEYAEAGSIYPVFAEAARQEGFSQAAALFQSVAPIEQSHGDRFGALADLMEQGKLFVSDAACGWMCLNCGHIQESPEAPKTCPTCGHPQGYFLRLELAPYTLPQRAGGCTGAGARGRPAGSIRAAGDAGTGPPVRRSASRFHGKNAGLPRETGALFGVLF
ncbi:MAG: rubrerythrin family protein [Oscillibacter sp.]|nr:rubrerythrin family protein [Oscillibacter sp.]